MPAGKDAGLVGLAEMAALAYPDRIGLRRKGEAPRWVLSGGKGAAMAAGLSLSGARLIVATDLDGDPREATVRQAVAITEAEVRGLYADRIGWVEVCEWSRREGRVRVAAAGAARGAGAGRPALGCAARGGGDGGAGGAAAAGACPGRRRRGGCGRGRGWRGATDWPGVADAALAGRAEDWLLPHLAGVRTEADLRGSTWPRRCRARLGWDRLAEMDRLAPAALRDAAGAEGADRL